MAKNDGVEEEYGKKETVPVCMVVLSPSSLLRFLTTGEHAGESLKEMALGAQVSTPCSVHESCLSTAFIRTEGHGRQKSKSGIKSKKPEG